MEVIIIPFIDHSLFLHPWFRFPIDKSDEDELAFVESKKKKRSVIFLQRKEQSRRKIQILTICAFMYQLLYSLVFPPYLEKESIHKSQMGGSIPSIDRSWYRIWETSNTRRNSLMKNRPIFSWKTVLSSLVIVISMKESWILTSSQELYQPWIP